MQAAEYVGRVLPDGQLELPTAVRDALQLIPHAEVKVILLREDRSAKEEARLAEERAAAWRKLDAVRERLSRLNFNLTDSLLQAREEEDAAL